MSAEWFCRSDQLQSMANSNPALHRTPSECRLVELCYLRMCFIWLKKSAFDIFTYTCHRTPKLISFLKSNCTGFSHYNYLVTVFFVNPFHHTADSHIRSKKRTRGFLMRSAAKYGAVNVVVRLSLCCSAHLADLK